MTVEIQIQDIMSEYRERLAATTEELIVARSQIASLNRQLLQLQEKDEDDLGE